MSLRLFYVVLGTGALIAFGSSVSVPLTGDDRGAYGIAVGVIIVFIAVANSPRPQDRRPSTDDRRESGQPAFDDSGTGDWGGGGGGGD